MLTAVARKRRRLAAAANLGGGSWLCSGDGGAPEGADERQRRGNTDVRWVFGDEKWWPSYGRIEIRWAVAWRASLPRWEDLWSGVVRELGLTVVLVLR